MATDVIEYPPYDTAPATMCPGDYPAFLRVMADLVKEHGYEREGDLLMVVADWLGWAPERRPVRGAIDLLASLGVTFANPMCSPYSTGTPIVGAGHYELSPEEVALFIGDRPRWDAYHDHDWRCRAATRAGHRCTRMTFAFSHGPWNIAGFDPESPRFNFCYAHIGSAPPDP